MNRAEILALINRALHNNGKSATTDSDISLRDAGFRSLDFSEVALRMEDALDRELSFEASAMRRIASIKDVIDFFEKAAMADAD